MSKVEEFMRSMEEGARPCLRLRPFSGQAKSYLGGVPALPPGTVWPERYDVPMSFVAHVDLGEASSGFWPDWMPREGALSFFYTAEQDAWGSDPADLGAWLVLYFPPGASLVELIPPAALPEQARFQKIAVRFEEDQSLPSYERAGGYEAAFEDAEFDEVNDRLAEFEATNDPAHRMFGWPAPVQNDTMELECQLASNGIDLVNAKAYKSERAKELEGGASDWDLLLQIDSDDDANMMWGDGGMLYFWVRREDAAKRDFSKVWMVSQCH